MRCSNPDLLPVEAQSSALGNSGALKTLAVRIALEMGLQAAAKGREVHNLWR